MKLIPSVYTEMKEDDLWLSSFHPDSALTIVSDSAQDARTRQLVDYLCSPHSGIYFMDFVNIGNENKMGESFSKGLKPAILDTESISFDDVALLLTDNVTPENDAKRREKERFQHIGTADCAAHGSDLVIVNISTMPIVKCLVDPIRKLLQWISRQHDL